MALTKLMVKTHEITFQNCLRLGSFPSEWKKTNVVPTFKKCEKQCIKNSRPVSLHPICSKVNGYFITTCFHLFSENNLIPSKQSGFKPSYSCTKELLSIAQEIL